MRDWCLEIPEVVNISINTPYPGTETWHTESRRLTTRDYRLFDIQHAVLPTKLATAGVLQRTRRDAARAFPQTSRLGRRCASAQVSLSDSCFADRPILSECFGSSTAYISPELQLADHRQPVKYEINLPPPSDYHRGARRALHSHENRGRSGRQIDHHTEEFVNATRMGVGD